MAEESMAMRPWGGLSPYESFMISEKSSKRPSGAAITGLVLGSLGLAIGAGAWIFGGTYAASRAKSAEALANVQYNATNNQLNLLTSLLAAERNERVAQGTTISQTITDSISGQQTSSLTAQQAAELSSVNSVMQQTFADAVTGRSSLNPTPVSLYSPAKEFTCGCPCNG